MLAAKPARREGSHAGRTTRRASERATKVPLSKKCKLDIKRKHLRAAIPGSLNVNSYAVNLQLQIDGENLPDLYKCTIKKHVNNKTSCVSYRLQGSGIYTHLRGLYMRGFCDGHEPGVVVLVASRHEAPDLPYAHLHLDAEDGEGPGPAPHGEEGSGDEQQASPPPPSPPPPPPPPPRQRRQARTAAAAVPRVRRQRKRRRADDTEEEEEEAAAAEAAAAAAVQAQGGGGEGGEDDEGSDQAGRHRRKRRSLRSHPLQPGPQEHPQLRSGAGRQLRNSGSFAPSLHAHALSSGAGGEEEDDEVGVSALDVEGVAADVAEAVAEAERRAGQAAGGGGAGQPNLLEGDPFDPLSCLDVGMGGLGGVGATPSHPHTHVHAHAHAHAHASGHPHLHAHGQAHGAGHAHGHGHAHSHVHGAAATLGLAPPVHATRSATAAAAAAAAALVGGPAHPGGGGGAPAGLGGGLPCAGGTFQLQRGDSLVDLPLSLSPFSPRLLDLPGRPHMARPLGQPQPQASGGWAPLPNLDFESGFPAGGLWPPRQQLGGANWPDALGLL